AQWQRALSGITNHLDYKLPCYVAVYAQLAGQRGLYAPAMATWISEVSDLVNIPRSHHDLQSSIQKTKQRLEHSVLSSLCPIDVKRNILAQALLEWLNDTALITTLTTFTRTAPLTPSGVILADVASHSHSGAWTSWITAKTGLQPILTTYPISPLPLPNFLPLPLPDEPNDGGRHVVPSWCDGYKAAWLVMIVLCLALTTSTWNNQQFITRLARNLDIYWKTPDIRSDEKRKALQTLIRDQAQLQEISSMGIPIHLSGGLYRGMIFLPLIENVIANYRSAETNSFTLNSILLFDTGKAMLKTDATPLLHQALEKLQANAAKTVLIAGHTDNIGNPDSNITLSEARARAVRDWFVKNSNFPITHFAIQGYGDSRPITDNRNEISRANNRRVDITLLSKDTTTNPEVREPPVIHNKVTN
ncbi:OmpA family protein, partial [Glaciimonas sp. GG7]